MPEAHVEKTISLDSNIVVEENTEHHRSTGTHAHFHTPTEASL